MENQLSELLLGRIEFSVMRKLVETLGSAEDIVCSIGQTNPFTFVWELPDVSENMGKQILCHLRKKFPNYDVYLNMRVFRADYTFSIPDEHLLRIVKELVGVGEKARE